MSEKKDYLGDSVYADTDKFGCLILTTENGEPAGPGNRIVIEPDVLAALLRYVARARAEERILIIDI